MQGRRNTTSKRMRISDDCPEIDVLRGKWSDARVHGQDNRLGRGGRSAVMGVATTVLQAEAYRSEAPLPGTRSMASSRRWKPSSGFRPASAATASGPSEGVGVDRRKPAGAVGASLDCCEFAKATGGASPGRSTAGAEVPVTSRSGLRRY